MEEDQIDIMLTVLTLNAADAGCLFLNTSISDISEETRVLCTAFVKHYNDKCVSTEINIIGPRTKEYYQTVIDNIYDRTRN